ncbi:MAG: Xaa-Pro aminopeptidase [Flavobacteriales bacterium]|nr:Xaa-Pro aminopeptidase [Flavobacteriales bacterium]MAC95489.1 Xaa-Pro aminopeptidase [Flavobacteriales bacterium]|tara:strand:+ start:516 stop:1925 length:1410 start_codon:yes stop_codon:yes gene_type:complete
MKQVLLFTAIFIQLYSVTYAQEQEVELEKSSTKYYQYDNDFLPASFHKERRNSLRAMMPDSTVAVFFSAPERNRSNDVYYEYHQDPNFYYLSGLREPNSMLIIYKEEQDFGEFKSNEVIFVQERDEFSEVWNGRRLGVEGAVENLGVSKVLSNEDFKKFKAQFENLERVYFQKPYALEEQDTSETTNLSGLFTAFNQKLTGASDVAEKHLQMMMAKLRQVKTEEELVLLRKAIEITCEAQNELMRQINDSMKEYETEAIIEYVFKRNGAEYPGFPSIQGSGENSCILHYTSNRRPLKNGGLLVSDVGAEYHGYTADVTRTIPPDGSFSEEEAAIYNLVLKAQQAGIDAAVVGNSFWAPHKAAQEVIIEGLKELGIIKKNIEIRKYFMHGTSHYLGLDVHDAGLYMALEEGNVITVEPGIYIAEGSDCDPKWWNIGVRIEDDILITKDGPENLSAKSPRTIEEIMKLMRE